MNWLASGWVRCVANLGWLVVLLSFSPLAAAQQKPQRIISLAPHITEILFAVGAGDQVVGVLAENDFPPEASEIAVIGRYNKINYEAVLAMQPTLVIGWDSGNGADSLARLTSLGLNVYSYEPRSLQDVAASLRYIGELSGQSREGAAQYQQFNNQLQLLRKRYQGKSVVSVYYQLASEPKMTVNDEHVIADILRVCGAANIFADALPLIPRVNTETILRRNPQVIVTTGVAGEHATRLDEWRQWPSLSAVKYNHLYAEVHPDLLHRQGPRILQGAEQLCELIDRARSD